MRPGLYHVDANEGWTFHDIACALRDHHDTDWAIEPSWDYAHDQRLLDPRLQLTKLANNAIFLCAGLVAQEVFVLAAKAGLDPARLLEVLKTGSAGMYLGLAEVCLRRDFELPIFALSLAEKDVALALDSARELETPMPVVAAAHQTYLQAKAQGHGAEVFFATLRALEAAAGAQVPKLGGQPPKPAEPASRRLSEL